MKKPKRSRTWLHAKVVINQDVFERQLTRPGPWCLDTLADGNHEGNLVIYRQIDDFADTPSLAGTLQVK